MNSFYVFLTLGLVTILARTTAMDNYNLSSNVYLPIVNIHGHDVFITHDLKKKIEEESITWHWTPWKRTRITLKEKMVIEDCPADSIDSFPDGFLTSEQLRKGGFLIYVLFGIYSFTLLALVCNDYFIPCVEMICDDLKIPQNVAAATFMAVATSCPEFFVNIISTFITESDMGIGTIVGSAIFNTLGVAAVGGIAARKPIPIEVRPVTRDVLIYLFNIAILMGVVWDSQVDWYEAVLLGILYVLYFILMFNSTKLFRLYDRLTDFICKTNGIQKADIFGTYKDGCTEGSVNIETQTNAKGDCGDLSENVINSDITMLSTKKTFWLRLWQIFTWPLRLILSVTVPNPLSCRILYPLTFIMCIIWIGINSYLVSWSMTVIGTTLLIPDSVMGMTFLAFGGCLPEACSIYIMSRKGEGGIGVSNALGANSLDILFALGLPWLIRILILLVKGSANPVVYINSSGIDFVVASLSLAVVSLWITLHFGKYQLRKLLGYSLLGLYIIFITLAILIELGVIFNVVVSIC